MKYYSKYCLLFLMLSLISQKTVADFLNDRERGWYWFEEHDVIENNNNDNNDKKANPISTFDPNKEMGKLQKAIKHALNLAILLPTEENIQNFMRHQIKAFSLSQRFTDATKILQTKYPILDYQIQAPYNHQARIIKNQEDRQLAEGAVKRLAATHGLFFFFDSTCSYCIAMAPNVVHFSNKYGLHLIPISVDGGRLKEFSNSLPDNGIATAYGVTHLPALFAVNPKTQEVLKLANRVTSITELEDVVLRLELQKGIQHGY